MDDSTDFMELLRLQDSLDFVTKSELLEQVRARGGRISDRQLTTYVTEGLVPKSARIGSRGGAYPRITIELISFLEYMRRRGVTHAALRELVPVWRHLFRARRDYEVSLVELQQTVAEHVRSDDAAYAMPLVLLHVFRCPNCSGKTKFVFTDGSVHNSAEPVSIRLLLAKQDESGRAEPVSETQIVLPFRHEGEASTIVMGLPPDADYRVGDLLAQRPSVSPGDACVEGAGEGD